MSDATDLPASDALALLDAAADLLRAVAPDLSGEGRYAALLAANAVATARREVAVAGRLAATRAAVGVTPAAIRDGRHDDDAALHDRLLADAALRAWVADPTAPRAGERAADLAEGT